MDTVGLDLGFHVHAGYRGREEVLEGGLNLLSTHLD